MRKIKSLSVYVLALLLASSLISCNSSKESTEAKQAESEKKTEYLILPAMKNTLKSVFPELYYTTEVLSEAEKKGALIKETEIRVFEDGSAVTANKEKKYSPDVGTLSEYTFSSDTDNGISLCVYSGVDSYSVSSSGLFEGCYGVNLNSFEKDTANSAYFNSDKYTEYAVDLENLIYRSASGYAGICKGLNTLAHIFLNNAVFVKNEVTANLFDGTVDCTEMSYKLEGDSVRAFYGELAEKLSNDSNLKNLYFAYQDFVRQEYTCGVINLFADTEPDDLLLLNDYEYLQLAIDSLKEKSVDKALDESVNITANISDGCLYSLDIDLNTGSFDHGLKIDFGVNCEKTTRVKASATFHKFKDYGTLPKNTFNFDINISKDDANALYSVVMQADGFSEEYDLLKFETDGESYSLSYGLLDLVEATGKFSFNDNGFSYSCDLNRFSDNSHSVMSFEIEALSQDVKAPEFNDLIAVVENSDVADFMYKLRSNPYMTQIMQILR